VSYPDSYRHNSPKEKHLLECVDNFRRQYIYIYPDRKPLLLVPLNECDIEVNVIWLPSRLYSSMDASMQLDLLVDLLAEQCLS